MKRLASIKPHPCAECSARDMHERYGDVYARAIRHRREDESLPDYFRRMCIDDAFRAFDDDEAKIAAVLGMTEGAVNKLELARLKARTEAARFVRSV